MLCLDDGTRNASLRCSCLAGECLMIDVVDYLMIWLGAHPLSLLVDLEGVEPSSERGNHKLSTCLSLTSFSCSGKTKATNRCLIFFEFRGRCEATVRYPRFGCTTVSGYFRAWCRSDVPFPHLVQELSDPTVLQIKQRERSCFRQIIARKL